LWYCTPCLTEYEQQQQQPEQQQQQQQQHTSSACGECGNTFSSTDGHEDPGSGAWYCNNCWSTFEEPDTLPTTEQPPTPTPTPTPTSSSQVLKEDDEDDDDGYDPSMVEERSQPRRVQRNWPHEAFDLKDKASVIAWATCTLASDGSNFTPQDNGKFIVRIHNEKKGLYNLCVVYKQRMTAHPIKIDAEGGSTVNAKSVGNNVTSLNELITALSKDPLPPKWPIKLIAGRDAVTGQVVPSGEYADDDNTEDEV